MVEKTALALAHETIARRAADPKAKFFGLSDDLKVIGSALHALELQNAMLAAALLRTEFGITKHRSQLRALASMGEEPAAVLRLGMHGDTCTCHQCAVKK